MNAKLLFVLVASAPICAMSQQTDPFAADTINKILDAQPKTVVREEGTIILAGNAEVVLGFLAVSSGWLV